MYVGIDYNERLKAARDKEIDRLITEQKHIGFTSLLKDAMRAAFREGYHLAVDEMQLEKKALIEFLNKGEQK
jgi:hypothetical protein